LILEVQLRQFSDCVFVTSDILFSCTRAQPNKHNSNHKTQQQRNNNNNSNGQQQQQDGVLLQYSTIYTIPLVLRDQTKSSNQPILSQKMSVREVQKRKCQHVNKKNKNAKNNQRTKQLLISGSNKQSTTTTAIENL
jgi:hypothetical protein